MTMTREEFLCFFNCDTCKGSGVAGYITRLVCSECGATGKKNEFDDAKYVGQCGGMIIVVANETTGRHNRIHQQREPWLNVSFWFSDIDPLTPKGWSRWRQHMREANDEGGYFVAVMPQKSFDALKTWQHIEDQQ